MPHGILMGPFSSHPPFIIMLHAESFAATFLFSPPHIRELSKIGTVSCVFSTLQKDKP